jgi:hypothetical protein
MVFYVWRPGDKQLEAILGGFSGQGTHLLGDFLATAGPAFWPPAIQNNQISIGAFILNFTVLADGNSSNTSPKAKGHPEIFSLKAEVLARRLKL